MCPGRLYATDILVGNTSDPDSGVLCGKTNDAVWLDKDGNEGSFEVGTYDDQVKVTCSKQLLGRYVTLKRQEGTIDADDLNIVEVYVWGYLYKGEKLI